MDICYIIYFDGNRKTGHAAHARGLATGFLKLGHRLHVIAPGWIENTNSEVKFSRTWQYKKKRYHTLSFGICSFFVLASLLFRNKPDVVYARYFNFLFLLLPLLKIFRVPLVVEHNADICAENTVYGRHYFSKKFHLFAERLLLSGSDGSIVVTQSMLDSWRKKKIIPKKSIVVRNGVNDDIYKPQDSLVCKQELGLSEYSSYIVFVGSFGTVQGVEILLHAFELMYVEDDSLNLLLVGADKNE
jgi:glycosyltransferase involved in cell wall biosynthesis